VKELVETIEFQKAIDTAKKLLSEFGDTEVAKQNKDLADQITKRRRTTRASASSTWRRTSPQAYKERRATLFGQYAARSSRSPRRSPSRPRSTSRSSPNWPSG